MTPHDSSRVPGNPETAPRHKSAWGKCGATDCYPLSDLFEPRFRPVTGSVRLSDLDNFQNVTRSFVYRKGAPSRAQWTRFHATSPVTFGPPVVGFATVYLNSSPVSVKGDFRSVPSQFGNEACSM